MESNTKEPDLSQSELTLEEPHFDEEATLLSARPVVPLEVVEAKSRSATRWLIGSAIVVALFVGAFAATLIYKARGDRQTSGVTATDASSPQNQPSVDAGVSAVEAQEPERIDESQEPERIALDTKQPEAPTVVENVKATSPPMISTPPPPRVAKKVIKLQQDKTPELIDGEREVEERIGRAESREERRPRRVEKEAKHQSGDRDRSSTDDLLRIREIFEGRPKP